MQAVVNSDGSIPRDRSGKPIYKGTDTEMHQEDGYYLCFKHPNGNMAQKHVIVPRGVSCIANGDLDSTTNAFAFETEIEDDDDFHVTLTNWGAGSNIIQKSYSYHIKVNTGTVNCGTSCTPLIME